MRNIFKSFKKLFSFQKVAKNGTKLCWKCFPHSLLKACDDIDADIKRACSKNDHKRFEALVKANGGYIEKKNKLFIIF